MEFCSIDVETANADMASICQIGVAIFSNGSITHEWSVFVDPEDYFAHVNVSIHGITEDHVTGAPKLPELYSQLKLLMEERVCVCHTHFDRVSLGKAFARYNLEPLALRWLDSAKVARRVWDDCAYSGYGLSPLAKKIGYEFKHHDALEDAKAAGHILLKALEASKAGLDDWLVKSSTPISVLKNIQSGVKGFIRVGNPSGEHAGNQIVFTGSLSIPRSHAADVAASVGFDVADTMTKKVDVLVVGDQDVARLAGKEKSSKHLKAEDLIVKGFYIRIIKESDFLDLVNAALSGGSANSDGVS